ncbi:hypothetical protein CHS0354_040333 [Potamilus streckersoni]|uniref:Peptidase M14 domain-containing protein n=1 Tax=Potamilus streckersoni TaxID=2493646 RepID=A0AAE0SGP0_9BIVA|nr:hypothetical protein CHS0354_040333 [Potamilus streckersoni]
MKNPMPTVWTLLVSYLFMHGFTAQRVNYNGYKVLRVLPRNEEQLTLLQDIILKGKEIDVWRAPSAVNSTVDLNLSPNSFENIVSELEASGIYSKVLIDDVQQAIYNQQLIENKHVSVMQGDDFDYGKYHTLEEINDWVQSMAMKYKTITTIFNITNSYEGRPMLGLKISSQSEIERKGFWIEGGIHAREWIAPATVIYMAGYILDHYKSDPQMNSLLDMFDWYIVPVVNPDGYEYTWSKDRMWRKTRSRHGVCIGVDPNRNWDMEWCKSGASKDPCSDDYCGPFAFSEVEVKGVADYIMTQTKNITGFIDFHSYSQLWMTPWGYTKELPPDFKQQDEGAMETCAALQRVNGTKYEHGSIANIIYIASGSSADWTYAKAGIKYSYGVELRDTGKYGFLLPSDQIIPSGEETLRGLVALAKFIYNNK